MIESGVPGITSVTYYGIFGPAGLGADVVNRLNSEVNASSEVTRTHYQHYEDSASSRKADRRRILRSCWPAR